MDQIKRIHLTEKTTIPLTWLMAAIPLLVGGIVWITTLYVNTQANAIQIDEVRKILVDVQTRVIRIEQWQKDKIVETDSRHSGEVTN